MSLNPQKKSCRPWCKVKVEQGGRPVMLAWTHTEALGSPVPVNLFSYMPDTVLSNIVIIHKEKGFCSHSYQLFKGI